MLAPTGERRQPPAAFEGTGVSAFLPKPYSSEQLIALVSRLARRPS